MSLLLGLALAASAQSSDLAIQAIHNFGACIVEQTPNGARELLAMDYSTKGYREKLRAIAKGHDRCLIPGSRLGFDSSLLFAGALAEALLESARKSSELPVDLAYIPTRAPIQSHSDTETMALCAVMHAPEATADLLATEPATSEEKSAIGAVTAVLPECLTKGMTVNMNRPALRSLLALAAWRIVTAPKEAAQ
jgi:hypothetical protein